MAADGGKVLLVVGFWSLVVGKGLELRATRCEHAQGEGHKHLTAEIAEEHLRGRGENGTFAMRSVRYE